MLKKLKERPELISAIFKYEHHLRDEVEQIKAVVQLADGSFLHLNEVWLGGALRKYAYYQLTPTNDIIRGWDNAPHHPEISTHPHHLHRASIIQQSDVRSLDDLLSTLAAELSGNEAGRR